MPGPLALIVVPAYSYSRLLRGDDLIPYCQDLRCYRCRLWRRQWDTNWHGDCTTCGSQLATSLQTDHQRPHSIESESDYEVPAILILAPVPLVVALTRYGGGVTAKLLGRAIPYVFRNIWLSRLSVNGHDQWEQYFKPRGTWHELLWSRKAHKKSLVVEQALLTRYKI